MNNYAISTDELASGLQKSSATLSLMGNSIDEAAALITAGNATIQDVDSVAAGIKTVSLRLSGSEKGSQEQLEQLGEEIDDYVVQTVAKKQQIIKDYTKTATNTEGVDIVDDHGNLKTTFDILSDISEVYREIQEEDKKFGTNRAQALVEELAGKNRSNIVSSILLNGQLLEQVKNTSEQSLGSADVELEKYKQSLEGRIQEMTNQLQELATVTINSDMFAGLIDGATVFLDLVTKLIDNLPILSSLIGGALGIGATKTGLGKQTIVVKNALFYKIA